MNIENLVALESQRQQALVNLSAASSLCPEKVRKYQGSVFSNLDAEGAPSEQLRSIDLENIDLERLLEGSYEQDGRFNGSGILSDLVEVLAEQRLARLFADRAARPYVNLQSPTGTIANCAVYNGLLNEGDVVLSMRLNSGGHLSHGSSVHHSSDRYVFKHYGIPTPDSKLDYAEVAKLVEQHRPKLLIGGASSYPWEFDWRQMREIVRSSSPETLILADLSHTAGLVAGGVHSNPFPFADVVTFTTYKTLCGPRGAAILSLDPEIARKVEKGVFPGSISAPIFQQIVAMAEAFSLADTDIFRDLQRRIQAGAKYFAERLSDIGFRTCFTGTDSHMAVAACEPGRVSAFEFATQARRVGMVFNVNQIPGDRTFKSSSGLRFGMTIPAQMGWRYEQIDTVVECLEELKVRVAEPALQRIRNKLEEALGISPLPSILR